MSREESYTAILVAAESLLRAADYPACRGLPAVTVATTLLGQLAGAVASVVDGGQLESTASTVADMDRPGFCHGAADCWRVPDLPGGTCHHHSEYARQPHPWERAQLRAGVFAVGDGDE